MSVQNIVNITEANLQQVLEQSMVNIDDILYGHAAFSFIGLLFTWG